MSNNIYLTRYSNKLDKQINNDDIYLICQYFIHSNPDRCKEIQFCLKKNIQLNKFKKIILLNERIYTLDELGLTNEEGNFIQQININKRLKYIDVLLRVKMLNINGYIVFANSDIFFDQTILNVRKTCLSTHKTIYALLRFEFLNSDLNKCNIFTYPNTNQARKDSQDVWIYHTSQLEISSDLIRRANFMLGMPGCDNSFAFILNSLGYKCINEPYNIKTYHFHTTQIRNYQRKDWIPYPHLYLEPIIRQN